MGVGVSADAGVGVGVAGGGDSGYESARDREEVKDDEDAPPEVREDRCVGLWFGRVSRSCAGIGHSGCAVVQGVGFMVMCRGRTLGLCSFSSKRNHDCLFEALSISNSLEVLYPFRE